MNVISLVYGYDYRYWFVVVVVFRLLMDRDYSLCASDIKRAVRLS